MGPFPSAWEGGQPRAPTPVPLLSSAPRHPKCVRITWPRHGKRHRMASPWPRRAGTRLGVPGAARSAGRGVLNSPRPTVTSGSGTRTPALLPPPQTPAPSSDGRELSDSPGPGGVRGAGGLPRGGSAPAPRARSPGQNSRFVRRVSTGGRTVHSSPIPGPSRRGGW